MVTKPGTIPRVSHSIHKMSTGILENECRNLIKSMAVPIMNRIG